MQPRGGLTGRTLLGKLRVVRRIGAGGSGAVYEVEHLLTHNRHALKVLHPSDAMSPLAAQRLVREAGVAGRVNSGRIVQTIDVGQLEDGRPFILMELLEGRSWRQLLEAEGSVHPTDAIRLALQVCEGLAAAHSAGIVHRDLKPDNVFLTGERGREDVKILDFGIGKQLKSDGQEALTVRGALMGTPHYLSPEQAQGRDDVDTRVDQYALAVMLYESIVGRRPFRSGGDLPMLLVRIAAGEHQPLSRAAPHLPPGLAGVIERGMSVDRDARFDSIEMFAARLRSFVSSVDGAAPTGAHVSTQRPRIAPPVAARSPVTPASSSRPRVAVPVESQPGAAPPGYASIPDTPPSSTLPALPRTRRPPPMAPRRRWVGPAVAAIVLLLLLAGLGAAAYAWMGASGDAGDSAPQRTVVTPPVPLATDAGAPDAGAPVAATPPASAPQWSPTHDAAEAALVREIRALTEQRRYEECLRRSEQDEPTPAVLERRAICAGSIGCFGVYRRACARLAELTPNGTIYHQSCLVLVDAYPVTLERGRDCHYRGD